MCPDKFEAAWQSHNWRINPDNLAEAMQQLDRSFNKTIFWRDAREIGVSLALIPVWISLGVATSSPWTWWLEIPALVWVAGFMFVDRRRQQRAAPAAGAALRVAVEHSLSQVEHQIWLLRNILWWYLLPLGIPLLLFFVHLAAERSDSSPWLIVVNASGPAVAVTCVFGFIYWLNQFAVRKQLEPLRERLQAAFAALEEDETAAK